MPRDSRSHYRAEPNFVRRNLRNRRGVGRKRPRPRAAGSTPAPGPEEEGGGQRRGLANLGIDPLSVSVEGLGREPKRARLTTVGDPTPQDGEPSPAPRGLVLRDKPLRGKQTKPLSVSEADLQRLAPLCPAHRLPARLLVVKKAGPNRGRRFYGCSLSSEDGCGFFMWAEDNLAVVREVEGLRGVSPLLSWEDRALARYRDKLSSFSLGELKVDCWPVDWRHSRLLRG